MNSRAAQDSYERGMEFFESGNWDLAIANFTNSINFVSNNPDVYHRRGEAFFSKSDYGDAIDDYDRAINLDANRAIFWLHRGWAFHNIALYDPDYIMTRDWIGEWSWVVDRGDVNSLNNQALSDIDNSLRLDPLNHTAWHNRGWLHLNVGNYQQAIDDCNQAIEIDPNISGTWNNRGMAYQGLNKFNEAFRDLDHALSLSPNDQLVTANKRRTNRNRWGRRYKRFKNISFLTIMVIVAIVIAISAF